MHLINLWNICKTKSGKLIRGEREGDGPSKKGGGIQQKIQKLIIAWGDYYLELESNCLIVSLVLLKFLRWQQHHFCLFEFVLVCLWIYCAPRKKSYTVLPEGTDIHIQQHNHQKDLNPCLSLYYYGKVIGELENTNKEFNCVYGFYNLTK